MRKFILALALVCIVTGLFAFDIADHIQGRLYFQDSQTGTWYAAGAGFKITVKLLYGNHVLIESADVFTISTGDYSHNFTTEDAEYVSSTYQSLTIEEYFDGIVRIDIYYDAVQPVPDPEPNND